MNKKIIYNKMSTLNVNELNENLSNKFISEKKNSGNSLNSNSTAKSSDSEKENEDKINNKIKEKQKKHVTFTKPVYTLIDVESYKKLNEDISETRFYYLPENKEINNKKRNVFCGCIMF